MPAKKKAVKKAAKKTTHSVLKKISSKKKPPVKKKPDANKISQPGTSPARLEPVPGGVTATINATFTNTDPGLSILNATLNGEKKKLIQTGTLSFDNVVSGDVIIIQGKSLGNAAISIDIPADPVNRSFPPGTFNFNFIIL